MVPLDKIRSDLKEIRYYYSRKAMFDECKNIVIGSSIMEKVRRDNEAVKTAPPRLYDMYMMLYVKGYTQEALSAELNYTPVYTVKVDADDVEGDERFAIVQFKFREIIRSELGEIGNFGFHRVLPPNFYFAFRQGRSKHRARDALVHSKEVNRKSTTKDKIIAYG